MLRRVPFRMGDVLGIGECERGNTVEVRLFQGEGLGWSWNKEWVEVLPVSLSGLHCVEY
jgi:hypothetical protein